MNTKNHNDEIALREFYSIALAKDLSFIDKAPQVLSLGCQYLDLSCGIISYVEGERYTILHTHTTSEQYQIQGGDVFELGLTYCKFTLEQKEPVGFSHVKKTDVAKHPSYEALKLEAYLGAPIFLNGKIFGTVNFSSIEPRSQEFTDSEKYYIKLISEWISTQLENQFTHVRNLESHKSLTVRLEKSPLASIEWTTDFVVTRWSRAATTMFGWREEQVINKSLLDWPVAKTTDQELLRTLMAELQLCRDEESAFYCDFVTNTSQPISTEWFVSSKPGGENNKGVVQTQILDITERISAENELLNKSARFIDLYKNAPDMYISIDQVGNIITANELCYRLLKYNEAELLGKPYWNLILKDDLRRIRRLIDVAFVGDVEELEMEACLLAKNNDVIRTHQRIRIIQAKKGMPRELRILARDITERKQGQVNRIQHIKQQRDEISQEVQHRIKNSLQAVIGLLQVSIDANPEVKPILTNSIAQVNTISIVNGLILDGKENVDILLLLKSLIKACSQLFGFEIKLQVESEAQLMLLGEEIISISLIVTELLTNALKYHGQNSNNEDSIVISIKFNGSSIEVKFVNTCRDHVREEDDSGSHLGKGMIDSLLPPEGATLNINQNENYYEVSLLLSEPVVEEPLFPL